MQLTDYYMSEGDQVSFSRDQASRFAKQVADDFNPLHNPDSKMFCVPGDLLFAVALNRLGLSQSMSFTFSGMVSDKALILPRTDAQEIRVTDAEGKEYLSIHREGATTHDAQLIQDLVCRYVTFSGHTFPHLLVPLMAEQGVMINPGRPLIMYQSMAIQLKRLEISKPSLEYRGATLDVQGKKGMVRLDFRLLDGEQEVGHGSKHMALRGLQAYEEAVMQQVVDDYNGYKSAYGT
ncbi:MAG: DUF3581 family protein [Candidatus Thiodiazotropha sp.]